MFVSLADIPNDGVGATPAGTWHIGLRDNFTASMGRVQFDNGTTVIPVDGRQVRRIVGAMSTVVWLRRVEDGRTIGRHPDADAPRPVVAASVPVAALEPALALAATEPVPEAGDLEPAASATFDSLNREGLKAFAREMQIDGLVDMRAKTPQLREAIRAALEG